MEEGLEDCADAKTAMSVTARQREKDRGLNDTEFIFQSSTQRLANSERWEKAEPSLRLFPERRGFGRVCTGAVAVPEMQVSWPDGLLLYIADSAKELGASLAIGGCESVPSGRSDYSHAHFTCQARHA